jgi:hypothetical protein
MKTIAFRPVILSVMVRLPCPSTSSCRKIVKYCYFVYFHLKFDGNDDNKIRSL